jgi:hypothetical protein
MKSQLQLPIIYNLAPMGLPLLDQPNYNLPPLLAYHLMIYLDIHLEYD